MTEQTSHGDSALQNTGSQADTQAKETNANMQRLANDFLDQGIHDATKGSALPESTAGRIAVTTVEGLRNVPAGLVHAVADDWNNKGQVVETLATSAAMGAALKTILPETGVAGKVAGLAIGGYFMYRAATPIGEAYSKGIHAKTAADMDSAGKELGDAAGGFAVNSVIAAGGYRVGAGFMGKALASEKMDGFALAKDKFWNRSASDAHAPVDHIAAGADGPMQTRIKVEGNRAHLLNSERSAPKNATVTGDVDPKAPIDITVYAQTKGSPLLMERYIARIAAHKAPALTDAQITEKFGADDNSVLAIRKFAEDHGLKVVEHNAASGRTRLSGSTEDMMKAFDVKLQEYTHTNGTVFRGRTGTVSVPTELAVNVKAVMGLDNRPQFKTNYVKGVKEDGVAEATPAAGQAAGQPAGAIGSVEPHAAAEPKAGGARALDVEEVFKAYNADIKWDGAGMTTGFLSLGGTLPEGWEAYLQSKGIDPKTVEIRKTSSVDPTPDPAGANGENALDLFIHKQGLPKATTAMVTAENNDTGMPTGIDRMTFPQTGESQITHGSISWGMFEDGWTDQARAMMEDAAKRAALKNITITVASGDNGAGDGSPSKKQQVDDPAGLAWVTGSGGTRLLIGPDGKWNSEVGWDGMGASGGGRSMKTGRPDYQKGLNLPPNLNGSKFDGRGVPDIAANADPRSGWKVFTDDGVTPIGGTSAAAPADAVKAAKISQATGKSTGFWNPEIYQMAAKVPGVFHDIVSGRNSDAGIPGYPSGKGWDAQTGNGSIDVGNYIAARNKMFNQSTFARNLSQIPDFVRSNQTHLPAWAMPYQHSYGTSNSTTDDNSK